MSVGYIILAISTYNFLHHYKQDNIRDLKTHEQSLADAQQLVRIQEESGVTFINIGATFPFPKLLLPFHNIKPAEFRLPLLTGTRGQTPYVQNRLREHGIEYIEKSLCTNPNLLMLARSPHLTTLLERFIGEHFDMKVKFSHVFAGNTFKIYRCSIIDGPR